jgi:hypothetical protein
MRDNFGVTKWEDVSTKYDWNCIADQLKKKGHDRKPAQAKQKWYCALRPGINRSPWTRSEVELLMKECTPEITWFSMETLFSGRTYQDIRSTWEKADEYGVCSVVAVAERRCEGECACQNGRKRSLEEVDSRQTKRSPLYGL